jgi:ADP-ribosylglycohydrolase
VSAVAFALSEPAQAVTLAAECSRTTHQSPVILDACRGYGAQLVGALRGVPAARLLEGAYEPAPGLWRERPLRPEVVAALSRPVAVRETPRRAPPPDVVAALANARAAVAGAEDAAAAIRLAIRHGREPALDGALAGALAGALWGASGLPAGALADLARRDVIDGFADRFIARLQASQAPASRARR